MYVIKGVFIMGFPGGASGKNQSANARDAALIPELGISFGEGNGIPLQYSCLENPVDRATWRAKVLGFQTV